MNNMSYIEVTVGVNPINMIERRSYKWIGKSPYACVGCNDLEREGLLNKKIISIGGYRLMMIERDYCTNSFLFVKKDWLAYPRLVLYKSTRFLDLAYRRIIITLCVWNLAKYHEGRIPSWRDIKIPRFK
jgi:hypothetical protein